MPAKYYWQEGVRLFFGTSFGPFIAAFCTVRLQYQLNPALFPAGRSGVLIKHGATYLPLVALALLGCVYHFNRRGLRLSAPSRWMLLSLSATLVPLLAVVFLRMVLPGHEFPLQESLYLVGSLLIVGWCLQIDVSASAHRVLPAIALFYLALAIVVWLLGFSIFFRGDVYEGTSEFFQWRFSGLTSSNEIALAGLYAAIAFAYSIWNKPFGKSDWGVAAILIGIALATRGRASFLTLVVILLIALSRLPFTPLRIASWSIVFGAIATVLVSLQISVVPVSVHYPFVDERPSFYSVIHETYEHIDSRQNWLGRTNAEIKRAWKEGLDTARVDTALSVLKNRTILPRQRYVYHTFKGPHSSLLALWAHFGHMGGLIYAVLNLVLAGAYLWYFGATLPSQVTVLSLVRCYFEGGGFITILILAFQVSYLLAGRRNKAMAPTSVPEMERSA